jgi:hypothetical protein
MEAWGGRAPASGDAGASARALEERGGRLGERAAAG